MQTISSFKPHGYKTLSNSHGIEIMVNDSGEEVSYRYSDDLPGDLVTSTEILFDQEGDPYFRDYHLDNSSTVYYLNEFMKIQK